MGSATLIIVSLVVLLLVVAIAVVMFIGQQRGSTSSVSHTKVSENLRSLVSAQREEAASLDPNKTNSYKQSLALAAAEEAEADEDERTAGNVVTLEKKLMYANWPISKMQFRAIQIVATIVLFSIVMPFFGYAIWALVLLLTPLMVGSVLDFCVKKRFTQFDEDYPVMLLSYVGLLKTGMTPITGLEAAGKGLEEGSLVKSEIEILIERLRVGMSEDQAINAFGEDVPHPELELFVQSLILSRRVGGTLSVTLERLAKQVRKRQQFRQQAVAAVGMERSSLWAIAAIMFTLLLYLFFTSPELIVPAFSHPLGRKVFEGGVFFIIVGMYWSRRVTDIRV